MRFSPRIKNQTRCQKKYIFMFYIFQTKRDYVYNRQKYLQKNKRGKKHFIPDFSVKQHSDNEYRIRTESVSS